MKGAEFFQKNPGLEFCVSFFFLEQILGDVFLRWQNLRWLGTPSSFWLISFSGWYLKSEGENVKIVILIFSYRNRPSKTPEVRPLLS